VFAIDGKHTLFAGGSSVFGRHFAELLAGAPATVAPRKAEMLVGDRGAWRNGSKAWCMVADRLADAVEKFETAFGHIHDVRNQGWTSI
jgi:hypothetical protein